MASSDILGCAKTLASMLRESDVYAEYCEKKRLLYRDDMLKNMYIAYQQQQLRARADVLAGKTETESMRQAERLGQFLQFEAAASDFMMAEYKLNDLLGSIYKLLADAVDVDLSVLEA